MWILGSFRKELAFFYFPALLVVSIVFFFPELGETSLLFGLLATGLIDSGHVYTTFWRTYLHPSEWKSNPAYIWLPVCFFGLFFLWFHFGFPYMWSFVIYSTLFHHVRQVFGISRWYQKLNGRMDVISDRILYLLSCLPIVIYHFRSDALSSYYTTNDIFLLKNESLYQVLLTVYSGVVLLWIWRELLLWKKGLREVNRLLSVAGPAFVYGFCFLTGKTATQILFPLLFLHGVTYFGVMELSLTRTQKRFEARHLALLAVLATAFVMGLSEAWYEENIVVVDINFVTAMNSVFVALWLTPLFCHYAFDAIIWRKGHREAAVVFKRSGT